MTSIILSLIMIVFDLIFIPPSTLAMLAVAIWGMNLGLSIYRYTMLKCNNDNDNESR